jgi:hypothetical protein
MTAEIPGKQLGLAGNRIKEQTEKAPGASQMQRYQEAAQSGRAHAHFKGFIRGT